MAHTVYEMLPTPDAKPLLCGVSVRRCGGSELLAGALETGRKRVGWRSVDLWASGAACFLARPMAHNN